MAGSWKANYGRKLVRGGWYIEVRYYERFPTTSPSIFKLGSKVQKENAEGVIARNVPVEVQTFRCSARAAPASECPELDSCYLSRRRAGCKARRSLIALVLHPNLYRISYDNI
jgi:hypothetical protein